MATKKYNYCVEGDKIPTVLRNEEETYEFEIYNYEGHPCSERGCPSSLYSIFRRAISF